MVKILTHQKHPSVSLHKTLNAIGRSSKLYPMALLSTGPVYDTIDSRYLMEDFYAKLSLL